MKFLFFLGHPAHFHLFKNTIRILSENGHGITIVIKSKDVLEKLLIQQDFKYYNIYSKDRSNNKIEIAISLLQRDFSLSKIIKVNRPDLMIGTSAEITHIGKLFGIHSLVVNEDDVDAVPFFAQLSYPFSTYILTPEVCNTGKWQSKTINYNSYHELAYLHPNFLKNELNNYNSLNKSEAKIFIIRFAKLTAHHDNGKAGITDELAYKLLLKLKTLGEVFISSERKLSSELEKYRLQIDPQKMLDYISQTYLYIGDSQTMAAEAAVLGTPSIRFNDFVGKLGYLEELEHKYGLTYGIKTSEPEKLFQKIDELLAMPNLKEEWQRRRQKMLSDKIDVTAFMVWFIENYPDSVKVMQENPDYQYNFK